jgi:hypothetical protein
MKEILKRIKYSRLKPDVKFLYDTFNQSEVIVVNTVSKYYTINNNHNYTIGKYDTVTRTFKLNYRLYIEYLQLIKYMNLDYYDEILNLLKVSIQAILNLSISSVVIDISEYEYTTMKPYYKLIVYDR